MQAYVLYIVAAFPEPVVSSYFLSTPVSFYSITYVNDMRIPICYNVISLFPVELTWHWSLLLVDSSVLVDIGKVI